MSTQPTYSGPIYLVRNEYFNTRLPFKLHHRGAGMLILHNTSGSSACSFLTSRGWHNGHIFNNLFLGGTDYTDYHGKTHTAHMIYTGTLTPYSRLDYNGYRLNTPVEPIRWLLPPTAQRGKRTHVVCNRLAEFSAKTGYEQHGLRVDYDIFRCAQPPLGTESALPTGHDLRLRPESAPVDRGRVLPNINDGFTGKAPDMGCYELGAPVPHYGPR